MVNSKLISMENHNIYNEFILLNLYCNHQKLAKSLSQNYFSIYNNTTGELYQSKIIFRLFLITSKQFSKSIMPGVCSLYNPPLGRIFFYIEYWLRYILFIVGTFLLFL